MPASRTEAVVVVDAEHVYWSDDSDGQLYRTRSDRSDEAVLLTLSPTSDRPNPSAIAVDAESVY
ncbi:hypothetical protein [Sorangium sp. So ce1182]|uniref:hypothetical protein n=1 Tax=Sorangium sp. So ce1182 TaxID=3133334 RepID=UPI003F635EB7